MQSGTPNRHQHRLLFLGMFIFWTLQTACYALYSLRGDHKAAHAFIAMICEQFLFTSFFKYNADPQLVLFYTFCEWYSNFVGQNNTDQGHRCRTYDWSITSHEEKP